MSELPRIPPRLPGGNYPRADAVEAHLKDALERLHKLQQAFQYVLPYVHVDVRSQALQLAGDADNSAGVE